MGSEDTSAEAKTAKPSAASGNHHSIGELLRSLRAQLASLERYEQALAKKESTTLASSAVRGIALLVVAASAALIGAIVLFIGIGLALSVVFAELGIPASVAMWLGLVVVGTAVLVTGSICAFGAVLAFGRTRAGLPQTSRSIKETLQWIKSKLH
jgi:hypothetical protein